MQRIHHIVKIRLKNGISVLNSQVIRFSMQHRFSWTLYGLAEKAKQMYYYWTSSLRFMQLKIKLLLNLYKR